MLQIVLILMESFHKHYFGILFPFRALSFGSSLDRLNKCVQMFTHLLHYIWCRML